MAGKSRHGSMADQLMGVRLYHARPELDAPIASLQTNWSVVPANDNNPEDVADFGFERFLRMSPSVEEIMRQVECGEVVRNKAGQIVSIGRIRFSDGTQTEKANTYGPEGKLIQHDARMPVGAMLGTKDKLDGQLGGTTLTQKYCELSNSFFAATLGVEYPRFIKSWKRRSGENYTRDEAAAMLAQAISNTETMPPVTRCPDALPCGTRNVADAFNGMKKGKKGESGSIPWQDLASLQSGRQVWRSALREIRPGTKDTLDAAMSAKTMADVGAVFGHAGKHAERKGKAALIAANDDLMAAINASAA